MFVAKRVRKTSSSTAGHSTNDPSNDALVRVRELAGQRPMDAVALALAEMKAARKSNDIARCGEAGLATAQAYWSAGDLMTAERYLEAALAVFEQGGQHRRLGTAYKLHAVLFISLDKVSLALSAALKALGYPDISAKDRMHLYGTIAICFHSLFDLPTASRVLEEYAWPEAERSRDPQAIVACASRCAGMLHDYACWTMNIPNVSTVGADRPTLEPTSAYLTRAKQYLAICDLHLDEVTLPERAWALAQKGVVISLADGWDKAGPIFAESLALAGEFPRQQVAALVTAGMAARIAGRFEMARDLLLRARPLPAAEPALTQRIIAYELSYAFQALGEADAATEEMRRFADLQIRKTRMAEEWIDDAANKRRYGSQFELAAAKALMLGKVEPAALRRAVDYIENNLRQRLAISQVALHAHVSTRTLQNLFQVHKGLPASAFIRERRMQRADQLLREARKSVAQVAEASGYSSAANFSRDYRRRFGRAPSSVLHRGERISPTRAAVAK